MNRIENAQLVAQILSETRYQSGKSQEYMSMGLGVAKNTIYNWEKGTSCPTILQFLEWFELLNLNATQYILQICNPSELSNISPKHSDDKIENALCKLLETYSIEQKRALLYILYGTHGSDPNSVIQMILADLHCPMHNRVNVAQTIVDNYDIAEQRNELLNTDNILPDMNNLRNAVKLGKNAAFNKNNSY